MNRPIYSYSYYRAVCLAILLTLFSGMVFGSTSHRRKRHHYRHRYHHKRRIARTRHASHIRHSSYIRRAAYDRRVAPYMWRAAYGIETMPIIQGGPWTTPTYADSTAGDNVDGENLTVRDAAVGALGRYNGSVVVVDPNTGRILTMVNQKLALSSGFQPCSTIKVAVALAALNDKLVIPTQKVRIYGSTRLTMIQALAHSNNYYFAHMGLELGFERFSYYAHLFGYGEKAGWNIPGEQAGRFPSAPPQNGGVGMLTSFGEEISQTPLELAALLSAIANGGTLYYLQYPRNQWEAQNFVPRVKRNLDIGPLIPEIKPGLFAAVESGTARRARQDEPIAGKTGTCTNNSTHLGWFGSFNDIEGNKLVVVVLLTGGRPSIGPRAAGIAGDLYKRLQEQNYFASDRTPRKMPLVTMQACCAR